MFFTIQDYSRSLATGAYSLVHTAACSATTNKILGFIPKIITAGSIFILPFNNLHFNRKRLIPGGIFYDITSWTQDFYNKIILSKAIISECVPLGLNWWRNSSMAPGFPFPVTLKVILAGCLLRGSLAVAGPKLVQTFPEPWGYFTALYYNQPKWVEQLIKAGFDVNKASPYYGEWTPLHFVCSGDFKSDPKSLELLLNAGANVHARDFEGNTPLHLAHNDNTVRLLIAHGADINSLNLKGQTPLHTACLHINLPGIDLMLSAGANPHARDPEGNTPLHFACIKAADNTQRRFQTVQALLAKGADPYALVPEKNLSPLRYAIKNIDLLSLLTKTENSPHFNSCRNLYDMCDLLFRSSKESLPNNWERIVSRIPKSISLLAMEKENRRLHPESIRGLFPSDKHLPTVIEDEIQTSSEEIPAERNLNALKSKPLAFLEAHPHPLMKLAWKLLNQTDKLIIEEVSDNEFIQYGVTSFPSGSGASYSSDSHDIFIHKNDPDKISSVLFECMNALQRDSFKKLFKLSSSGEIDREEYAILTEWIEYHSGLWHHQIASEMGLTEWLDSEIFDTFEKWWKFANKPSSAGLASHADKCRRQWDSFASAAYFAKHPDFIKERSAELSAMAGIETQP